MDPCTCDSSMWVCNIFSLRFLIRAKVMLVSIINTYVLKMCAWHRITSVNALGWRCTGNGAGGCSCCCTWPNEHFRIVTHWYDHRLCRCILVRNWEKKNSWCFRKLHAIEKLNSHPSWNCHFIYFMTWYQLFFFFSFRSLYFVHLFRSLACTLWVIWCQIHDLNTQSHQLSHSKRVENHDHKYTRTGEHYSCSSRNEEKTKKWCNERKRNTLAALALFRSLAPTVYVFTLKIRAVNLFTHVPTNSLTF